MRYSVPGSRLVFLCVLLGRVACAQPQIYTVMNSASYAERQIAQGSIFVVFGYGIGPAQLQQSSSYPLPTQLAGASIQVISGGTVLDCPMLYVSSSQAAAILPSNTPLGPATISLKYGGRASIGGSEITVHPTAFGIFSVASSGSGPGIITGSDYAVKGLATPARFGETVILWGTGLGPTDGSDNGVPPTGRQFSDVQVFVGTSSAKISYAGRSGCCAGLDQIAFEVPASVAGCFVPIVVESGGAVSNFVTMPVSSSGALCPDTAPGVPRDVLSKALNGEEIRIGALAVGPIRVLQTAGFQFSRSIAQELSSVLNRRVSESDASKLIAAYREGDNSPVKRVLQKYKLGNSLANPKLRRRLRQTLSMDQQGAAAAFGTSSGLAPFVSSLGPHLIPLGTCIVTREGYAPYSVRTRGLNAGEILNLSGPLGQHSLTYVRGSYQAALGTVSNLPPGSYTLSGSGTQDIPAFTASLNLTGNLVWTNKATIAPVDRSTPLTITWSGGNPAGFVLVGASVHSNDANTTLACSENAAKGAFTIPAFVLSALPAATAKDTYFFVAPHPLSNPVLIPGLDLAFFASATSDYQPVDLR